MSTSFHVFVMGLIPSGSNVFIISLFVWMSSVFLTAYAAEPDICVTLANGDEVCGQLDTWTIEQLTISSDQKRSITTTDIADVRFPLAKRRHQSSDWIVLGTGDRFPVTVTKCKDDLLTAGWARSPRRPEFAFPLENVAAIIRQLPPAPAIQRDWLGALQRLPPGHDVVRLVVGDDLTGEFTHWENGLVGWRSSLGALQLDLQRVRWIRFDPELTARPKLPDTYWTVFLTDGTRFTATACQPRPDLTVEWKLPVGGPLTIPRHEIEKLSRWSPQRQPLSRREPIETKLTPYLEGTRTIANDRSVSQSPLSLRGQEFASGVSMQSRAAVAYRVEPGDRAFRATVGIDDASEGRGSARFAVRVDDRVVWESEELTGHSPAIRLPSIPLDGAKTLTLFVDFGEYGDAGDLADWCDASIWQTPAR